MEMAREITMQWGVKIGAKYVGNGVGYSVILHTLPAWKS